MSAAERWVAELRLPRSTRSTLDAASTCFASAARRSWRSLSTDAFASFFATRSVCCTSSASIAASSAAAVRASASALASCAFACSLPVAKRRLRFTLSRRRRAASATISAAALAREAFAISSSVLSSIDSSCAITSPSRTLAPRSTLIDLMVAGRGGATLYELVAV